LKIFATHSHILTQFAFFQKRKKLSTIEKYLLKIIFLDYAQFFEKTTKNLAFFTRFFRKFSLNYFKLT